MTNDGQTEERVVPCLPKLWLLLIL